MYHTDVINPSLSTLSNHYIQMERNYSKKYILDKFFCVYKMGSAVQKFYLKSIQYGNSLCHLVWW